MVKGRALARPSEQIERLEPLVRLVTVAKWMAGLGDKRLLVAGWLNWLASQPDLLRHTVISLGIPPTNNAFFVDGEVDCAR